ncbi:MAG: transferase, partial [Steroidobacteraceae bacterium]
QDASERFGHLPDILVFIQCTSPFLRSADIDGMVTLLQEQRGDCALTACRFHGFVWRSPLHASGINHDLKVRVRRQDAMPEFLETGSAYAMQVAGFLAARHRFFGRPLLYEVPRSRSLEVDTLDDLKLARIMARNLEGRRVS